MSTVRGCELPENLLYDVDSNVWARREADGNVVVGMTSYACSLSGVIVAFTPRRLGKEVKRGKSCATVESGKWVGPVKAPVSGEMVAANPEVAAEPGLINDDPYGAGWLVKIRPVDWDGESVALLKGPEALVLFEQRMEADGFGGC